MATERIVIEIQGRGFRRVSRDVRNLSRQARRSTTILQQMRNALVVVASARVLQRFTGLADGFVNLRNRLQATLGSFDAAVNAQARIIEIARETRTSVDATGDAFARFALGTKGLGVSSERLLGITKTLNQALILSGTTAQEARNGLIQLSQGIASNRLSGDELRAVLEQLPPVSIAIAKELGIAVGQLRKFGEEGKITGEVVLNALENVAEETADNFENAAVTIEQSLTQVGTELRVFIDNFFNATGASNNLADAILSVAGAIRFLGENIGFALGGLTTIGLLIGGRLIVSIGKFLAGFKFIGRALRLARRQTGLLATAIKFLRAAFVGLFLVLKANPFSIAFTAASILLGAIVALREETQTFEEAQMQSNEVLEKTKGILDENEIATSKQAQALLNETFAARQDAIAQLELAEARLIANDALSDFGQIGAENPAAAQVAELREQIRQLTLRMGDLRNVTEDLRNVEEKETNAKKEATAENKKAQGVIDRLRFSIAQLSRSERDAAIAQQLFNAGLDFNATGELADTIRALTNQYEDLAAAQKLVEEQNEADLKRSREQIEVINRLKGSLQTRGEIEEEVGTEIQAIRGALVKIGLEEATINRLLADETERLVDARREELMPELVEFLDDNKTVREQLNDVEEASLVLKRQAIQDGMSVAEATAISTRNTEKETKAILDNTAARKLSNRFLTAEATQREFNELRADLARERTGAIGEQERENELLRLYLRDAAGASNATNDYAQAQQNLALAVKESAVSQEEAVDIARANRIELLESQRTLEAGSERAFLKFIQDATDAAAQTEALFTDVFSTLSDELFNFVKEGEFNFNNLVQTIIDGLIKIGIQQALGAAFSGAGGLFGGGAGVAGSSGAAGGSAGGIGGLIAGALLGGQNGLNFTVGGGSAAMNLPGIDNRLIAFKARDGEEVTVTPRGQGAGGGNAPINIVQNITTRDADSFKRSEGQLASRAAATLGRARRRA